MMIEQAETYQSHPFIKIDTIPHDWRIERLEYFLSRITYGFTNPMPDDDTGPYKITAKDISNNGILFSQARRTSLEAYQSLLTSKSKPREGDVLLTKDGTLGRVASVNQDGFCINQSVALLRPKKNIDSDFLKYLLQSQYYQHRMLRDAGGSTIKHIYISIVKRMWIAAPPSEEQRKIAEILGTWDEAIRLTEELIAARQKRKKSLMQQLLTGKRRFPGFADNGKEENGLPSGWKMAQLQDIFVRITRKIDSEIEHVLSITAGVGFVDQRSKFGRVIAGKNLSRYIHLYRDEFAYNKGNSHTYPQGCVYKLEEFNEGAVPNVYYCFKPSGETIIGDFYKYYFENGMLNRELVGLINTGVRNDGLLNLSANNFFNANVLVPPTKEQERIADFFSLVDNEIKKLKQKLELLKDQKKGLIQQLLTAKTRVKV